MCTSILKRDGARRGSHSPDFIRAASKNDCVAAVRRVVTAAFRHSCRGATAECCAAAQLKVQRMWPANLPQSRRDRRARPPSGTSAPSPLYRSQVDVGCQQIVLWCRNLMRQRSSPRTTGGKSSGMTACGRRGLASVRSDRRIPLVVRRGCGSFSVPHAFRPPRDRSQLDPGLPSNF